MKKLLLMFLCLATAIGYAGPTNLIDFVDGPDHQSSASNWSLGFEFTVNSPITLTSLGAFDYNQDGFRQPQQVGLWTAGGSLLASTYVDNTDPLQGYWRFHSITPLALSAGQNYIVASQGGEGYTYFYYETPGITVAPEITYVTDRWHYVASASNDPLAFPDSSDGYTVDNAGYFGGNARFGAAAAPEPASLALIGAGLLALGLFRRARP